MRKKAIPNGLVITTRRDARGRLVNMPLGADEANLDYPTDRTRWNFNWKIGNQIVDLYQQGLSVREISEKPGMPVMKQIYRWMAARSDFKIKMKNARELRGVYFEERALQAAEDVKGESTEEVAAQRLKAETFKWAAEVNNPDVYGKRTKLVGDPDAPIGFIVDTGIVREEKPPAIEVTPEKPKR